MLRNATPQLYFALLSYHSRSTFCSANYVQPHEMFPSDPQSVTSQGQGT